MCADFWNSTNRTPEEVMCRIEGLTEIYPKFTKFIQDMKQKDDTWKFWADFVFSNCYNYIGLYLAIRGSNWKLRVSSLKQMAPIFAAFDRYIYEKNNTQPSCRYSKIPPGNFTVFRSRWIYSEYQWTKVAFCSTG